MYRWSHSERVLTKSLNYERPCDVFPVQAAQDAVQQVADSSKETVGTGTVQIPSAFKASWCDGGLCYCEQAGARVKMTHAFKRMKQMKDKHLKWHEKLQCLKTWLISLSWNQAEQVKVD